MKSWSTVGIGGAITSVLELPVTRSYHLALPLWLPAQKVVLKLAIPAVLVPNIRPLSLKKYR